jgi:hypothetical protein
MVTPSFGFENLLRNNKGQINTSRQVECEVEPPDNLGGLDAENPGTLARFFEPLMNKEVVVTGTWVQDRSHTPTNPRTEIHPITSIFCEYPSSNSAVKRFEFFVFSDDSWNPDVSILTFPSFGISLPGVKIKVPHSQEDRTGTFTVPYPPRPPVGSPRTPYFRLIREVDKSASKSFQVIRFAGAGGDQFQINGTVRSGKPSQGKGFYNALIEIGFTEADDVTPPSREGDLDVSGIDATAAASTNDLTADVDSAVAAITQAPEVGEIRANIALRRRQISVLQQAEDRFRDELYGEDTGEELRQIRDAIAQLQQELDNQRQRARDLGQSDLVDF